jgi:hypothetical protein
MELQTKDWTALLDRLEEKGFSIHRNDPHSKGNRKTHEYSAELYEYDKYGIYVSLSGNYDMRKDVVADANIVGEVVFDHAESLDTSKEFGADLEAAEQWATNMLAKVHRNDPEIEARAEAEERGISL